MGLGFCYLKTQPYSGLYRYVSTYISIFGIKLGEVMYQTNDNYVYVCVCVNICHLFTSKLTSDHSISLFRLPVLGWNVFNKRRQASSKMNYLRDATEKELTDLEDVCSICFQQLEQAKVTGCDHYFHADCLTRWLYLKDTCPICCSTAAITKPQVPRSLNGSAICSYGGIGTSSAASAAAATATASAAAAVAAAATASSTSAVDNCAWNDSDR